MPRVKGGKLAVTKFHLLLPEMGSLAVKPQGAAGVEVGDRKRRK